MKWLRSVLPVVVALVTLFLPAAIARSQLQNTRRSDNPGHRPRLGWKAGERRCRQSRKKGLSEGCGDEDQCSRGLCVFVPFNWQGSTQRGKSGSRVVVALSSWRHHQTTVWKGRPGPSRIRSGSDSGISPRLEAQAHGFADQPKLTVAGVTDWTAVGGHGSDSTCEPAKLSPVKLSPSSRKTQATVRQTLRATLAKKGI